MDVSALFPLLFLLPCALMMVWMMRGHGHGHGAGGCDHEHAADAPREREGSAR